jgi:16S rRNA (uracil1498-N3)-methyltransferase
MKQAKIRLYVSAELFQGQAVAVSRAQAHYLFSVMRLQVGARVSLFNGHDGEFQSEVTCANKRNGTLKCLEQSKILQNPPDLWLLFAPIKKARTDFIVEKATEMGVARICPVVTKFTQAERVKRDRLQAHAVEAAEQCGGTFVPEVAELAKLDFILTEWPKERKLLFCDETRVGEAATDLAELCGGPWAILIGPEGGFSPDEVVRLRRMDGVYSVSLGPRILRADTAAVAALALWQDALGDWG